MTRHPLIGEPAPSFSLKNHNGEDYQFTGGEGPIALFFYPKAGM